MYCDIHIFRIYTNIFIIYAYLFLTINESNVFRNKALQTEAEYIIFLQGVIIICII